MSRPSGPQGLSQGIKERLQERMKFEMGSEAGMEPGEDGVYGLLEALTSSVDSPNSSTEVR